MNSFNNIGQPISLSVPQSRHTNWIVNLSNWEVVKCVFIILNNQELRKLSQKCNHMYGTDQCHLSCATWGCTQIHINYSEIISFLIICSIKVKYRKRGKNGRFYRIRLPMTVNENIFIRKKWKGDAVSQCWFFQLLVIFTTQTSAFFLF